MNRKDRIAVVTSLFLIPFVFLGVIPFIISYSDIPSESTKVMLGVMGLGTTVIYWSYRFIKDDISFLSSKDKQ